MGTSELAICVHTYVCKEQQVFIRMYVCMCELHNLLMRC